MIAIPRPPSTFGKAVDLAYTRSPGFEIRRTPAIERSRFWPYFSVIDKVLPTWPSTGSLTAYPAMYPSLAKISAIPTLILLCGMVAVSWYAWLAFRTRVNMSAIGSVIVIAATSSSMWFPAPFGPDLHRLDLVGFRAARHPEAERPDRWGCSLLGVGRRGADGPGPRPKLARPGGCPKPHLEQRTSPTPPTSSTS